MAKLVMEGIKMVFKIKDAVTKFGSNNKKCAKICDTVEKLSDGLSMLREASVKEHPSVRAAMQRLNDTLEETVREVEKCKNANALLRLFRAKDIASKLDRLGNDIYEEMLSAVILTSMSTNAEMQNVRQDVNSLSKDVAAILKHLGISDDVSNENRTGTEKTCGASNGLRKYSRWSDLEDATNNNMIPMRKGSSSYIYKAILDNKPVAIKKFHEMNKQVKARFLHELRLVQKLQHQNIVELLGFCFEYSESLVVEDNDVQLAINGVLGFMSRYMSKESMAEVIKGNFFFVWPSLFRIIQGIANGVHYLHMKNVVHLDLRPENILFDDMTPMINNFGKAQQLEDVDSWIKLNEEQLPSTGKYVAPELSASTGSESWIKFFLGKFGLGGYKASTKSDVYSFGVILLNTIGLMCATSKEGRRPRAPKDWAKRMEESELVDLFDPKRIASDTQRTAARWCVIVGLLCCLPDPEKRPSMSKVIAMLGWCVQQEGTNNIAATTSRSSQGKGKINMASSSSSSSSLLLYDSKSTSVGYKVLANDVLHKQQDDDTRSVADALSIMPGVAELLLRHYKWSPQDVLSAWFSNQHDVRKVAGLPDQGDPVAATMMMVSTQELQCSKCKLSFKAGQMWSAACGHFYCRRCWGDYIGMAASVSMKCLSSSCKKPVVRELVEAVAGVDAKTQYDGLVRLSYVQDSGGRRKWCPFCGDVVELLDDGGASGSTAAEVLCKCNKYRFCWNN